VGVSVLFVWLIVSLISRYSSLAAIFAAVIAPLFVFLLLQDAQLTNVVFLVAVILISKHYKNIINLMKGVESKIGDKNKKI
jgi:glycerol-3-phosphate acyltransferase PlsY